ncbi:MFS transporter [Streptomyces sp. 8N114]|uniref:MFS transporter n=1 Tax=Streptomyces sp. 8N114 TaxID=3457419 RepID=UPI003FD07BE9
MRVWRETRGFPVAVRVLLVNQFGVNTGFYLLIPYLATHLGQDLGLSAAVVGTVLGVRNLSQQGLFLVGGTAADRLGPRTVIIAGCALRTVGFGLFAMGDGMAVLLAASALSGFAGALFNPAVRTYLAREAGERKAEAFALFQVFATAGSLAGPVLGTALLLAGFRTSALVAAGLFLLLTVAQALALPARPAPEPPPGAEGLRGVFGDWREVLGDRAFLGFALAMVGMFAMENQLYLLFPAAARQATGWDGAAGLVFLTGTIASLTFQLRLTRALQGRGERARWIAAGPAVMGLAFLPPLLIAWADTPEDPARAALGLLPVLLGAVLLYAGLMAAQPFVMELVPAYGREGLTGTYFGVFYAVSGIAAAGGNALVGWAMDAGAARGAPWLPWVCCLCFGLLTAAGITLLRRRGAMPSPASAKPTTSAHARPTPKTFK